MRHISLIVLALAFIAALIPSYTTLAENEAEKVYWNQFRGPNGDGKSVATDLPLEFSENTEYTLENPNSRQRLVVPRCLG